MSRLPHLSPTPLVVLAAALIIGYVVFTTAHYVLHDYQIRHEETAARADMARLDTDHAQLLALRDYLKSDEYVEEVARRVLGLVRPGETLVIVSGPDGASVTATPPVVDMTPGDPWWKEFLAPEPAVTPSP